MNMIGDYRRGGRHDFGRKAAGRTYGTELDPLNCSFFLRTGACRHGNSCPKKHDWPPFGTTVLFQHLWIAPKIILAKKKKRSKHYDNFVEDLLEECLKYGHVQNILTVANMGDHMIGNTFIKFEDEEQAAACVAALDGRFYAGRKVHCKYSPVVDLTQSQCRDYELDSCQRGQFCNFAHFMPTPRWVNKVLRESQYEYNRGVKKSSLKKYNDNWPKFPVHGSRTERTKCIEKWNILIGKWIKNNNQDIVPSSTKPALNLFRPGDEYKFKIE